MRTNITATLAVAGLALTACGGSGEEAPPPQRQLTRQQFIVKTDALCKTSNTRTRVLNRDLRRAAASARNDEQLLARLAPILAEAQEPVRANAAAFRAVEPPAADAIRIERIRIAYDEQAELAGKLADATKRGDVKRFDVLTEEQRLLVALARRLARDYGFKECGSEKSEAT